MCAKKRGYTMFAVQYGGTCRADNKGTYGKHNTSTVCSNGLGGGYANDVYIIHQGNFAVGRLLV